MKNNTFTFPLSFDDIAQLIGNKDTVKTQIDGFITLKEYESTQEIKELIKEQIFKHVLNEWKCDKSVVVGENKLLTELNIVNYDILDYYKEKSATDSSMIISLKATISIKQDPLYAKEIKSSIKNNTNFKFKR